jgi:KipI family sensor histidine kinase inhibitor
MLELLPLGDRAWLARFASEANARNWALAVRGARLPGVTDIVLAYATVSVHLHPAAEAEDDLGTRLQSLDGSFPPPLWGRVGWAGLRSGQGLTPHPTLPHKGGGISCDQMKNEEEATEPSAANEKLSRLVTLPVLYDGEDLPDVAATTGIPIEEVIRLHSSTLYDVFAIGFQPGFPYAGPLPAPLDRLPRRSEPRVRVPSGSVAIAAGQTGVYPAELPGGWNLIGRTPLSIVDIKTGRFPIRAGDRLKFEPIDWDEFQSRLGEPLH